MIYLLIIFNIYIYYYICIVRTFIIREIYKQLIWRIFHIKICIIIADFH